MSTELDELDDQSLEAGFLESLSTYFPKYTDWFQMADPPGGSGGNDASKAIPSIKVEFKRT